MTRVKRRFIRLEEVEQKTQLTKGDVLEEIEQGNVRFCAVVELRRMAALHQSDSGTAVSNLFSYNGVVALSNDISRKFARTNKRQMVEKVLVLEPEKVNGWLTPHSVFGTIQNTRFQMISNVSRPTKPFAAFAQVEVGQSLKQIGINAISRLAAITAQSNPSQESESLVNQFKNDDRKYFQSSLVCVQVNDLRLDLNELTKYNNDDEPVKLVKQESAAPNISVSPLEQVVVRVLTDYPTARADKVWNLIRKDVNHNEPRLYDIDGIIDEMGADSLSWYGKNVDTENKMSYNTFRQNTVYQARKRVKN